MTTGGDHVFGGGPVEVSLDEALAQNELANLSWPKPFRHLPDFLRDDPRTKQELFRCLYASI